MTRRIQIQEAFKLALSMVLFYWFALWMDWDLPKYGALAIVLVSLGTTGASLQKAWFRLVGTTAGLAIGMLGLALFAQDRLGMMLFLSSYIVAIGYFMQGSRFGYAWFVAGFLPPLIWATTYGDVDGAFSYASFRYLETSAGIVIYTLVSALLWPQRAGAELDRICTSLWSDLRSLQQVYRGDLSNMPASADARDLRRTLAGDAAKMMATLRAAYEDTPSVIAQKQVWESLRADVQAYCDALEAWHECFGDGRRFELDRLVPGLNSGLDVLDGRLERIASAWSMRCGGKPVAAGEVGDAAHRPISCDIDGPAASGLSHLDRAVLMAVARQFQVLDETSRSVLFSVQQLCGVEPDGERPIPRVPRQRSGGGGLEPIRFANALFPAACFAAAFVFWIWTDPPAGPSVPSITATFGLVLLLTPMSAFKLLKVMLASLAIVIAPIYFLLMPRLDTGFELLTLIFVLCFGASMLGNRSPALKTMPLLLFVMMTGISNEQVYSFSALVDGGMMFALTLGIIAIGQLMTGQNRPNQTVRTGVRRFFRDCEHARVAIARSEQGGTARQRSRRRRPVQSRVFSGIQRLRPVAARLDYAGLSGTARSAVPRLLDTMQALAFRLEALELAEARVAGHAIAWPSPIAELWDTLHGRVRHAFHQMGRLEHAGSPDEDAKIRDLARGMEQQLEQLARAHPDRLNDDALVDLYVVLGCARGLVRAARETDMAMREIDWDEWAEARF